VLSTLSILCTVLYISGLAVAALQEEDNCARGLGLASGVIPDSAISATANWTRSPVGARLDNPDAAWCFRSGLFGQVSLKIDLGSLHLVSGLLSQGPPESVYGEDYLHYVGLRIRLSVDGSNWRDCCGGESQIFYADDRAEEASAVSQHDFGALEPAQFVRVDLLTDVRWLGRPEKCFRFEVSGCAPEELRPKLDVSLKSHPQGFLTAR